MFKKIGYKIEVASNGLEAIKALEQSFYDLVHGYSDAGNRRF